MGDFIPWPHRKLGWEIPLFDLIEKQIDGDYSCLNSSALTTFMEAPNLSDKLFGVDAVFKADMIKFLTACTVLFQEGDLGRTRYFLENIQNPEALFKKEPDLCQAVYRYYSDRVDDENYRKASEFHDANSVQSALAHVRAIRVPDRLRGRTPSIDQIIARHDHAMMYQATAALRAGREPDARSLLGRMVRRPRAYPDFHHLDGLVS